MNTTVFTTANAAETCRPRSRTRPLLWTAQILLAVFFFAAALPKLTGAHSSIVLFGRIGAGQWLVYFVGAVELAGAIGLLIRPLAGLAAVGLAVDMAGASIINVAVLHSEAVFLTAPLFIAFVLIARSCRTTNRRTGVFDRPLAPRRTGAQ